MKALKHLLVLLLFAVQCNKTPGEPVLKYDDGIAFSLRELYNQIASLQANDPYPEKLLSLGGMTRIKGYVVDKENSDVIIFGEYDESRPAILTENLIIAFKNSYGHYNRREGNVSYYSFPGCSIDPDPAVMNRLNQVFNAYAVNPNDSTKEAMSEQWCQVCESDQDVRVMGVPFNSEFAHTTVFADYDMKLLVDGSDSLLVPGFTSMIQMMFDSLKAELDNDQQPTAASASMNRFWFYPGTSNYLASANLAMIEKAEVTLLTEEEHLAKKNSSHNAAENVFAQRFAEFLTTHYEELAEQREVFAQLENLFRLFSLSQAFHFKEVDNNFLWFQNLLKIFQVSEVIVPTGLPGRHTINDFEYRKKVENGELVYSFLLPTCGGVTMEIDPDAGDFDYRLEDHLKTYEGNILDERPTLEELSWIFKYPGHTDLIEIELRTPNVKISIVPRNFA
jgi:hypothetical protein